MLKCLNCNREAILVPDEDVDEMPPTMTARQMLCDKCGKEWVEPEYFNLDGWYELEEQARA